ncbi:alkyl sulfatase C-terminal domain-containing protein [Cryobacterium sp. MLB-32]|uniref:alkyl sulfatase C-terminal domain-containing protein n=1 Tax=Cryobacterium sp. MLB-32 TaxID=1529318 RepID=UPI001E4C6D20|nr:alkyl sulfatase C-terminal domain-containing protein [Cryobacterium sp. MLB-32]
MGTGCRRLPRTCRWQTPRTSPTRTADWSLEACSGRLRRPTASADLVGTLTAAQVFDSLAILIDGPRAWDLHLALCWMITDGTVNVDGDSTDLQALAELLDPVDPDFAIVTP